MTSKIRGKLSGEPAKNWKGMPVRKMKGKMGTSKEKGVFHSKLFATDNVLHYVQNNTLKKFKIKDDETQACHQGKTSPVGEIRHKHAIGNIVNDVVITMCGDRRVPRLPKAITL